MFKKRDPVCGTRVDKDTEYVLQHESKTYYFDCQACKATFQENPENYLVKKSHNRFLEWIAKGSKQVPKSCHEMKE